jgi:hypothetical protein
VPIGRSFEAGGSEEMWHPKVHDFRKGRFLAGGAIPRGFDVPLID